MPVTSDASPFTSVTVSPMEPQDIDELPIELKVPLPSSSACSDEEGEIKVQTKRTHGDLPISIVEEGDIRSKAEEVSIQEVQDDAKARHETDESHELPHIFLDELAHLVQLEAYQRRQAASAQTRMDQLTLKCGLDRRMISTFSIAYGNMIDQYKTDDQSGFAMIYEACDQLKVSCNMTGQATDRLGLHLDTDMRPTQDDLANHSSIESLPPDSQEIILTFLTQIRTDPNFLSDRISKLSPSELTTLTSSYHPAGIDYSVLQNHSHGKTQFYSKDSQMMKLSRRMDNLHRFHHEDPFFALLYSVFDSSAKPGSEEDRRRTDIWSTTCARNFTEAFTGTGTRPGSDEFAIAALDAFANFQEWPLKRKMESYIMRIMVEGSFLLDQPSQQPTNFKQPIEMYHATAAIREAEFFEKALTDLFELLTTQPIRPIQQAVPESALRFVHAILRKITDPKLRLRAKHYIVCRWYFATFVSSIVLHPEVCGIMMTHHVGDTARQQILQQLVLRLQQRVFDVTLQWNDHALVNPKIRDGIMAIFQVFEPPDLLEKESAPDRDDEVSTKFLMLSALDTIGLIQTLYPDRTSNLEAHEPGSAAIVSDRPSTAGSSTLIAGSSDVGSAEASSTAPSSIEASDKPVNDESSATAAHAEEQESGFPLKGELKNTPAKTTKVVKQDLAPQLQHTCGRLRHLLAREETSTQKKAWTMLYYSEDGSALSMGPKSTTNGQQSLSIKHSHEPSRRRNESDKDHRAIKAAVTDLLNEDSKRSSATLDHFQRSRQEEHSADPVERLIYEAMGKAQFNLEFGAAHSWWRTLGIYRDFLGSNPAWYLQNLLQEISEDLRRAVEVATKVSKDCDVQCRSLVRLQYHHNIVLTQMEEQRKALRIKTWYVSEVRHSATYEEALLVTRVLRTMASSKSTKQPGGLSNWARQRLRGSGIHDRSEAQTIEALAAPKEHGGLSKLADEQVELTSRWLTRKSIENFCKGEERIHRFCYEIQRSVGKIAGPSLLESPVLWSSYLFKSERISFGTRPRPGTIGPPCGTTLTPPSPFGYSFLQAPVLASPGAPPKGLGLSKAKSPMNHYGGFWTTSQASRAPTGVTSQPLLPPTPTSPPTAWSSNVFTSDSPLHTFAPPQLPVSGFGRHSAHSSNEGETSPEKKAFAQQIKKNLCSLLLSDLGYHLWNQGSETDAWINEHIADEKSIGMQGDIEAAQGIPEPSPPLAKRLGYPINPPTEVPRQNEPWKNPSTSASESSVPPPDPAHGHERPTNAFPFLEAYTSLLWSFSLTHDPYAKLYALYELEDLIIKSLYATFTSRYAQDAVNPSVNRRQSHPGDAGVRSKSVPRTKATSLEEIIANCTERRAGTLRFQASKPSFILSGFASEIWTEDAPSTDDIVNELLCIFRSSNLRPTTLFRDLQYIAAFVPSEILDQTPQGKAFWDVALAALALKDDLCDTIITRAHGITAYHIPSAKPSDPSMDNALASTTLRDAANLWLITAKEGSPIAARELGLFYLTHPELLPRITMPFSKAKDVFKSVMSTDYRTGDKERGALDPYTFAVVRHWMEIAANGGDKDARDFLRGSGDVDVGR